MKKKIIIAVSIILILQTLFIVFGLIFADTSIIPEEKAVTEYKRCKAQYTEYVELYKDKPDEEVFREVEKYRKLTNQYASELGLNSYIEYKDYDAIASGH